jgi:hypothetical protein
MMNEELDAKLFRFLIKQMQTNRNKIWSTLLWAQTVNERREALITLMRLENALSETTNEQL